MALSFDQYRYFSAAWVRDYSRRTTKSQAPSREPVAPAAQPAPQPASVIWLAQPRVPGSNKPA